MRLQQWSDAVKGLRPRSLTPDGGTLERSRLTAVLGRVTYSDALSGRDLSAVNKTIDGLLG